MFENPLLELQDFTMQSDIYVRKAFTRNIKISETDFKLSYVSYFMKVPSRNLKISEELQAMTGICQHHNRLSQRCFNALFVVTFTVM